VDIVVIVGLQKEGWSCWFENAMFILLNPALMTKKVWIFHSKVIFNLICICKKRLEVLKRNPLIKILDSEKYSK